MVEKFEIIGPPGPPAPIGVPITETLSIEVCRVAIIVEAVVDVPMLSVAVTVTFVLFSDRSWASTVIFDVPAALARA